MPPPADPTPLPMTEAELAEVRELFMRTSQANGIVLRLLATMDARTAELHMLRGPTPIPLDRADVKPLLDMMREDRVGLRAQLAEPSAAYDEIAALCGCPEWEYPGQIVRDVQRVVEERDKLHAALTEIDAIRNSIVGLQQINWSAHIYPLVAALERAGFPGEGYDVASVKAETLLQQRDAAEADLSAARSSLATAARVVEAARAFVTPPVDINDDGEPHRPGCNARPYGYFGGPCDCGLGPLAAALAALPKATP